MLAAAGGIIFWGIGSLMIKKITAGALVIAATRSAMGIAFMVPLLYLMGGRLRRDVVVRSIPGGAFFGLHLVLFYAAIQHTTVANATVIGALQPILVFVVMGRMFGEQVRRSDVVASLVAIVGVAVVVFGSSGLPSWSLLGDGLAVANLLAWTGYFLASKRVRVDGVGTIEYLTAMLFPALVITVPVAALSGQPWAELDPPDFLWILGTVAVVGLFGHGLINWAHPRVTASFLSVLGLGVPIVATVSVWLFLGEDLVLLQVVGMAVVVAALSAVVRAHVGLPASDRDGGELPPPVRCPA